MAYTAHPQLRPGTESVDYSVAAKTISFSDKRAGNDIQDILKDKEAERHSLGGLQNVKNYQEGKKYLFA